MGQYWKPIILKEDWKNEKQPVLAAIYSWTFGNGLKLMEHSYVGNEFVQAVCELLKRDEYFGHPFVWCGDYADAKTTPFGEIDLYNKGDEFIYDDIFDATSSKESQAYEELVATIPKYEEMRKNGFGGYIVNLTKNQYVKIPDYSKKKEGELLIHPLPLLCADGNNRGGGDFHEGKDFEKVGIWAYDKIGIVEDISEYSGFEEIEVDFVEA